MPRAAIALALVLLFSFRMAVHKQGPSIQPDYQVYYTAATLVRLHLSTHLYDDADSGRDPQMRLVDPQTVYAQTAANMALVPMMLFVYPPLLADAMVPITLIPRAPSYRPSTLPSMIVWRIANTLATFATAWLLAGMLALRRRFAVLLFLAIFLSGPVSDCIGYGQVTVMLMLLWTGSMALYARGSTRWSAVLMATATAIKLTPLLALLPFLCWREWKWVRWYGLGLLGCVGLICLVNGPQVLADYLLHVLPPMAGGIANETNKTIASSLQLAWLLAHGVPMSQIGRLRLAGEADLVRAPGWIMASVKGLVLLALAALAALLVQISHRRARYRSQPLPAGLSMPGSLPLSDRLFILAAFGALSVALAPVSWMHAYCLAVPMLVLSWARMLRDKAPRTPALLLLTLVSLETGSFALEGIAKRVLHGPALAMTGMLVPVFTLLWVFYEVLRIRSEAATSVPLLREQSI